MPECKQTGERHNCKKRWRCYQVDVKRKKRAKKKNREKIISLEAQHKWERKCCILVCILIGVISVYLCNVVTLNTTTQKREAWDVIAQAELWGMQAYVSSCTQTRTNTNTYCWFDKEIQHILWCAPASCQLTAELSVPTVWTEWSCCPTQRLNCSLLAFPENEGDHWD